MSSVVIAGDTSGSITVSAPAVAGSNTLTLPAATGTVIYSNGSGNLLFNSGYGSVATAYGCRAWVKFNGTGTIAINGSGNVTSLTDNGTGRYTVNFTTSLPDVNYSAISSNANNEGGCYDYFVSSVSIFVNNGAGSPIDSNPISLAVFR